MQGRAEDHKIMKYKIMNYKIMNYKIMKYKIMNYKTWERWLVRWLCGLCLRPFSA